MKRDFEIILNALIPEHLKENNPVVTELFRIFLEFIDETSYSKISNISNLVTSIQEDESEDKSSFSFQPINKRQNIELKMAFVNLFATNINHFFDTIKNDRQIDAALTKYAKLLGLEKNELYDMSKLNINIDEEIISCSKPFAETKGTKVPFDFLSNLLENENLDPGISPIGGITVTDHIDHDTEELVPCSYEVESSLHNVVFNRAIRPIVHPVGFNVIYTRVLRLLMEDAFNLKIENYGFSVVIKQRNGKTYSWKDELDASGNVTNQLIKTFKSDLNEYGIEELDIRFMTGERLYRTTNGDFVYYDKQSIPHSWSKKFYELEYNFKKRITVLTKDSQMAEHTSYIDDQYDIVYQVINGKLNIIHVPVSDYTEKIDHIDDNSYYEDIKDYNEPDLTDHKTTFYPEEFPEPEENSIILEETIWLNNSKIFGLQGNQFTYQLKDVKEGNVPKIQEDDELFWNNTDYYVNHFIKILSDLKLELAYNQDMYDTYATRKGRTRIGAWKGFSDPRAEKDCRDVPMLTGNILLAKIRELKNLIVSNEEDITNINGRLNKVLSSREEFYFVIQGEDLIEPYIVDELIEHIDEKDISDTVITSDLIERTTILINMSNADGMSVGSVGIGQKPLGYEDSMDTDDGAGIYTYTLNNGVYSLVDYIGFLGDVLTLDSDLINDYRNNITELNSLIAEKETEIADVVGVWGTYTRIQLRLERDDLIKTLETFQQELDIILNKYNN
jgi:hypothetical protein